MELKSPLIEELSVPVPAANAAVDATTIIGRVPFDAKVEEVKYVPNAAINGANVDTRTIGVVNKGANGAGATGVASLALAAGVNAGALVEKTVTPSVTPANLNVNKGDVLVFTSTHAGNGLADPGGILIVKLSRRYD